MDLGGLVSKKKSKENFWAVVLEPEWIQAGIWTTDGANVEVVSSGAPFPWKSEEELIGAADSALSSAVADFPEDATDPSKTVFGVSGNWVNEGQIKEEYLSIIKKLCSELSLVPVGFVVLVEAVAHIFKSEEGSPLTAVVVGVVNDNIEVSYVKGGKISGTTYVARSVSLADDVIEGLTRLSSEDVFPSRIILFNAKDAELEEARQNLMEVDWEVFDKVKFLHTPKVEIVPPNKKVTATALAGGSEIANATGVVDETQEVKQDDNVREASSDANTDFVIGKDVLEGVKPQAENNSDFQKYEKNHEILSALGKSDAIDSQIPLKSDETVSEIQSKIQFSGISVFLRKIRGFSSKLGFLKLRMGGGNEKGKVKIGVYGISVLAVLLIGTFLYWWFIPKATVVLYVSPKRIEDRVSVEIKKDNNVLLIGEEEISVESVDVEVAGEKTTSATGKKTVGERAKGRVTLYRSGSELTISSGTEIKSKNNLKYTLDEGITIASGSAGNPGKTETAVTAVEIGSEYNLASGESFSVGNYPASDIEAKNDSDFSGGSSREINAVSEQDLIKLENELREELTDEANDKIKSSLSDTKILIDNSLNAEESNQEFSAKAGDETDNLKLGLKMKFSGLVVERNRLTEFSKLLLKDKVPQGFVLRDDQIKIEFVSSTNEEDGVGFDAVVKANLLPEVKPEEVTDKIAGKYPDIAREFLLGIEGFDRAEIKISPQLPGKLGNLPRLKKNIDITVTSSD